MDIEFQLRGIRFRWNDDKAKLNAVKHGVSFEQAAQVFLIRSCDTSTLREAASRAMEPWDATSMFEFCSSSIC